MVGSGPWHRDHTPPHPHTRMLHARAASETERPWKTLKMAQIYDFPRAARAEHGHGAKKVLAGVRFQWTDPKKFLRPRWRAGGRSVSYVPFFASRASLCLRSPPMGALSSHSSE